MCKKSLRTAINMHERILSGRYKDGNYNGMNKSERLEKFKSRLNELEPSLKPCPFCGELPVYEESCLSHHGVTSGSGGWAANIECTQCDYLFKGSVFGSVVTQWNNRITI